MFMRDDKNENTLPQKSSNLFVNIKFAKLFIF